MKFFLDFIEKDEKLKKFLNLVSKYKGHQGTIIRISESFLSIYSKVKKTPKNYVSNIFYSLEHYLIKGFDGLDMFIPLALGNEEYFDASQINIAEIQHFKSLIPYNVNKSLFSPLEVIVNLFNDAKIENFNKLIKEYRNNENFSILIEKRSRNLFLNTKSKHDPLIGGISISPNDNKTFGTLGGFLKNKSNNIYGLTCSHVVSQANHPVFQPAKYDSELNRKIGIVVHSSNLTLCNSEASCNSKSSIRNMDVSLIKIDKSLKCAFGVHGLGQVTTLMKFRELYQGMKVVFNGRTTNEKKHLTIGGLCVSYKIAYEQDSGVKYACFSNLIELRSIPIRIFNSNYFIQSSPVLPGDSGSWICYDQSKGLSWCGMLISGDADRGYFLSSEHIIKWLTNSGFKLKL